MAEVSIDPSQLVMPPHTRMIRDLSANAFPSRIMSWADGDWELPAEGTHYGFVASGTARLSTDALNVELTEGMYFSIAGKAHLNGHGVGFVATRLGDAGFNQFGGPIEATGRLRYINGCTDSVLISPVKWGDPCLNLLHVPPHTNQSRHTHPSFRTGMIVSGRGVCRTDAGDAQLEPGQVFFLPEDFPHSFHTTVDSLLIVAWHPDSDFGPTDEHHPMLNRTILDRPADTHSP